MPVGDEPVISPVQVISFSRDPIYNVRALSILNVEFRNLQTSLGLADAEPADYTSNLEASYVARTHCRHGP